MPAVKVYTCAICHKVLEHPKTRLVYQEYLHRGYGHFINRKNFDFCDDCFKYFRHWIIKNNRVQYRKENQNELQEHSGEIKSS